MACFNCTIKICFVYIYTIRPKNRTGLHETISKNCWISTISPTEKFALKINPDWAKNLIGRLLLFCSLRVARAQIYIQLTFALGMQGLEATKKCGHFAQRSDFLFSSKKSNSWSVFWLSKLNREKGCKSWKQITTLWMSDVSQIIHPARGTDILNEPRPIDRQFFLSPLNIDQPDCAFL